MPLVVVEILIALGLLAGGVVGLAAGFKAIRSGIRGLRGSRQPWYVHTRTIDSEHVIVEVVRPGEKSQEVAVVDTSPDEGDFESILYEAQARAKNIAMALNSSRRS